MNLIKPIAVLALTAGIGVPAFCQAAAESRKEVDLTRQAIQQKRQDIVSSVIELTEEEGKAFWPLYRDWRAKMAGLGDRTVTLIEQLNDVAAQRSDQEASAMLDEWMKIKQEELKLRKEYIKKFGKVLPMKKVARFIQLEAKMDSAIQYDLAGRVPLID